MKKILFLLAAFALFTTSYASSGFLTKKASEIYLPLGKNLTISLQDLSVIKISDYERLSGRHLKLRHSFAADGTITNNQLLKAVSNGEPGSGFNIGWFALGLFTGLIGVLLSYIINGDEDVKRNRHKWAWIGWGVWVVIVVLTLL
jgi:hypothetical protein